MSGAHRHGNPPVAPRRRGHGFTLVELMVAITLGLLLTAAISTLFVANKRNYRQNNLVAEMQDNARFTMQALVRDLAMAGFLGGMNGPGRLDLASQTIPALGADCGPGADDQPGWAFDAAALEFVNDAAGASIAAIYACLGAANVLSASDVVSIRRVAGLGGVVATAGAAPTLAANRFYLRTNRTEGSLFFSGAGASVPAGGQPPLWFWEYSSQLYFVRPYSVSPGDGIPTLCRAALTAGAAPTVAIERVAEGVEVLQLAFGIDSDGDGVVNRYRAEPDDAQLAHAVTARIVLLMRSIAPDPVYHNDKRYDLLGRDDDGDGVIDETGDGYVPDDQYYRRVLQTTVMLRNPALNAGVAP